MWDKDKVKARQALDRRFAELGPPKRFQVPAGGWVKSIRHSLGMNAAQVASRMGVARQRISEMEAAERQGVVTLKSLRRAAEAMDCVLVYAIMPRTSLNELVEERAVKLAKEALDYVDQTMALEGQADRDSDPAEKIKAYISEHIAEKDLWSDK